MVLISEERAHSFARGHSSVSLVQISIDNPSSSVYVLNYRVFYHFSTLSKKTSLTQTSAYPLILALVPEYLGNIDHTFCFADPVEK